MLDMKTYCGGEAPLSPNISNVELLRRKMKFFQRLLFNPLPRSIFNPLHRSKYKP
jgi:hypothetical protein